ncbi:MAG: SIR2 family protein [Nitrosomonas sp.]|nr:SIR2 family protein [Nitrosomonas sp.]
MERSLPDHSTIQRSDIECLSQLLHQRTPFICKLHGSVSAVESMVFSQCDYDSIQVDNVYLDALQTLFLNATVLFLGYGVQRRVCASEITIILCWALIIRYGTTFHSHI